jgi:branched-chain amino acid aminotransferase
MEGTGYNFFMVKDGVVKTPEPRNVLRGVSRRFILENLTSNIPTEESNISMYDLLNCDEAWITGTPFCMLPVRSIQGTPLPNCPGPIYSILLDRWSKATGVNIAEQIIKWDKNIEASGSTPYVFKR